MIHTPVIEVKDLGIAFGTGDKAGQAVSGLSFTLHRGEIAGIVGESGSGKSVTALSLLKLLPSPPARYTSGQILFHHPDGHITDILNADEKTMQNIRGRHIGMIFQEPMTSLNPVYRCGPQVAEVLLRHNNISKVEAKRRTLSLFNEVLLPRPEQLYKSYPHQLSGGQKQRIMIAMAVANNPALIIADEPTTALDVTVQKSILQLLRTIRDKYGIAVVFITHDLGVVNDIADKVIVMYKGKSVEENNVKDLMQNPLHPYTKGLLACRPDMKQRLRVLPTVSDFVTEQPDKTSVIQLQTDVVTSYERQQAHTLLYTPEPLMQVKALNKSYITKPAFFRRKAETFQVLNNINFDIYKGETLGLAGESGCGKTTLGRALLRLTETDSGQVIYNARDILTLKEKDFRPMRTKLQIIFQDPYASLNPRMTIGSAIQEPMTVHGIGTSAKERRLKTIELLFKTGLDESYFNRYPHELSGGQRQRVVIARTLALEPEFIICDESVSALDVSVQAQVLNLLNKLKKEFGLTYIFISHDLSVVKYLSDRIMIMKDGCITEINEADAMYHAPKSDYTRALIDAIPGGS